MVEYKQYIYNKISQIPMHPTRAVSYTHLMAKNGVLIRHFDRKTLYTRLVDEMIPKETTTEKTTVSGWRGQLDLSLIHI